MGVLTKCYVKDTNLVTRDISGETIIVPIRNNVGDLDSIYTLNEVGTHVWQLIDGQNSIDRIIEEICNTYEVEPEVARKDIMEFLDVLKEAKLIRTSEGNR